MARAAVPHYLGDHFDEASPGARFGLYFAGWLDDWSQDKSGKTPALERVVMLSADCRRRLEALCSRQAALAAAQGTNLLTLTAVSTAPFVTGTGMEHPLENGFAFLNPYGLPYLPGAGVKGVLRRAAQDMAGVATGFSFPNPAGWTAEAIEALFGCESGEGDTVHTRGALQCWDVLPQPAGDRLGIDVLTPHQGGYYRGDTTPADCESPVPNPFLVVPPGSRFSFHVACDPRRLPEALHEHWRVLLEAAFAHAFDWLGFGARTRVGYGQLALDPAAAAHRAAEAGRQEKARAEAEAARAAEAARQAQAEAERREAAKPPELRAIEALQQQLEAARAHGRRQPAGGELQRHFCDTARAALGWAPDWRRQILPLLQELSQAWLDGDARKRRKTWLDPLQGKD